MMHDGGWLGMGGMGYYWQVPVLIVIVALVVWLVVRRRSPRGR